MRTIRTVLTRVAAALVLAAAMAPPAAAQTAAAAKPFSGTRALADVKQLVAIGPRVAGTSGAAKARAYITAQLKAAGLTAREQAFDAATPRGTVHMINLIAVVPGAAAAGTRPSGQRIVVGGHYDTKLFKEFTFVGANDGGSSAALLIELARALKPKTLPLDVELLFLDGEEAVGEWQGNDHTYGSRHYVQAARSDGTLKTIAAFVLVDMIGDKDLRIMRESNSTPWLTDTVWAAARKLGKREFVSEVTTVEDDHLEFLEAGVPSVDIIDLDYPAWHRADDTMDKLSAASLQSVGDVVVASLADIAARSTKP
jgi:Zn-dependent M28 family amino/carboxypeptidase